MIEIRTVGFWGEGHTEEWLEDAQEKNLRWRKCAMSWFGWWLWKYMHFSQVFLLCAYNGCILLNGDYNKFSQSTKQNNGEQFFRGYIPCCSMKSLFLNMIYQLDHPLWCLTLMLTYLPQPITTSKFIVFPQAANISFLWTFIHIAPFI